MDRWKDTRAWMAPQPCTSDMSSLVACDRIHQAMVRKIFVWMVALCVPLFAFVGLADAGTSSLKVSVKILDASGGRWTNEAARAFDFAEIYSLNRKFGQLCLQRAQGQKVCKGAVIHPDASVFASFPWRGLQMMGYSDRGALLQALATHRVALYVKVGASRYSAASHWLEGKKKVLSALAVQGASPGLVKQLKRPAVARLVAYQIAHMFKVRQDQPAPFDYVQLPIKQGTKAASRAASRPAPRSKPTTKKATKVPETKAQKDARLWLYHLQKWDEFTPYLKISDICSDRYTPKQALHNMNSLNTKQKNEMLRQARGILRAVALSFKMLGDSKVSGFLSTATDGIRLCQWSSFFASAYARYHSTNAKKAFWKKELISTQAFSLGLLTAFSYRFAKNFIEDVGKIVQAAQKIGHYGMVVAAWLLGKKYTGLTDMFCQWKRAKTLCKVVGTVVKFGKGSYYVLKSGYQIGAKGVVLTIRYSKKLYRGAKGVYYYFKGRPRVGKVYCLSLFRAGAFFRAEKVALNPKDWSPIQCQAFKPKAAPTKK